MITSGIARGMKFQETWCQCQNNGRSVLQNTGRHTKKEEAVDVRGASSERDRVERNYQVRHLRK